MYCKRGGGAHKSTVKVNFTNSARFLNLSGSGAFFGVSMSPPLIYCINDIEIFPKNYK